MSRARVLIVQELWWPKGGGGILATHLITKVLVRHGFEVRVVTGVEDHEVIDNVVFIHEPRLRAGNKLELWFNAYMVSREGWFRRLVEWADVVYIPHYAYSVIPSVKELGRGVIVHLHDYQPISYTSVIFHGDNFKSDFARTFYYELHQHGLMRALVASPLTPINRLAREWVSRADAVVCVSNRQCKIMRERMPEVRDKSVVIYNPLPDVSPVRKELGDDKVLLYLGGPSFVKGFHLVLRVANELLGKYRDLRILMTKVEGYRSLPSNCVALGELPYQDVAKLHSRVYALLFPSIWGEPLPYVVIESMLMGTIPIAARTGGVSEVVVGSPAEDYLFTPGDADELMDKIEAVLTQSRDYLLDVGAKLRDHVLKLFNTEYVENRIIDLFKLQGIANE
jgi:glycosyltransferase involved in cell wall biosynthesis